jgi:3-oxoacyl-(acyl-carrier-protein) synthase
MGSIGLGDGAAFAVLSRNRGDFVIEAQSVHNEMHHFTANRADGVGFAACLGPVRQALNDRRVWLKGHGTGTLEAGRLESAAFATAFPDAPLVAWKGSLGHTLGSCGLVELALACEAIRDGKAPGTVGGASPTFRTNVALESIATHDTDGVVCASNAFGGAHAAFLLSHA